MPTIIDNIEQCDVVNGVTKPANGININLDKEAEMCAPIYENEAGSKKHSTVNARQVGKDIRDDYPKLKISEKQLVILGLQKEEDVAKHVCSRCNSDIERYCSLANKSIFAFLAFSKLFEKRNELSLNVDDGLGVHSSRPSARSGVPTISCARRLLAGALCKTLASLRNTVNFTANIASSNTWRPRAPDAIRRSKGCVVIFKNVFIRYYNHFPAGLFEGNRQELPSGMFQLHVLRKAVRKCTVLPRGRISLLRKWLVHNFP